MLDVKGIPIMQRYIITVDFWHQQKPLIVLITIKCAGKHTCAFALTAISSWLSCWCWTVQIDYTSDSEKHRIPNGSKGGKILAGLILLDDSEVNIFSSLSGWINILHFVEILLFAVKCVAQLHVLNTARLLFAIEFLLILSCSALCCA